MWKETLIVLFALCTRVKSEADLDNKHSYADISEEVKNLPPLMSIQIVNPVHITKQEDTNKIYLIPTLQNRLPVQTLDIHQYNQNTNILRTIIIVPPKTKKPCDRNSSVSQPPIQTEKPTKSPSDTITTTEEAATIETITVSQNTKKPCNLSTTNVLPTSPIQVTPTSITLVTVTPTETTQTTATKETPKPNDVTPKPNDITLTPVNDPITKAPIIGDPDGSMKCIQDGAYRVNNVTCDQFYVCIHGIRYLMDCPYGLVFNNQLKICDWLENVSDCKPPAFKDFTCPDEGYGVDGSLILQFRYRDSCSQFVACHKRKPLLLSCDLGYYFHDESSRCMNFRSASNCRDVWYSY